MGKREDRAQCAGPCTHVEYAEPKFCPNGVKYVMHSEAEITAAFVPYDIGDKNVLAYLKNWPKRDPEGARKALTAFSEAFSEVDNVVKLKLPKVAPYYLVESLSLQRACSGMAVFAMNSQAHKFHVALALPVAMFLFELLREFINHGDTAPGGK